MGFFHTVQEQTENPNRFTHLAKSKLTREIKYCYTFTAHNTAYELRRGRLVHSGGTGIPTKVLKPRCGAGSLMPTSSYYTEQTAHDGDDITLFAFLRIPTAGGNKAVISNQNSADFVVDCYTMQLVSNTDILFRRRDSSWRNITILTSDWDFTGKYCVIVGRYRRTGASSGTLNLSVRDIISGEGFTATPITSAGWAAFGAAVDTTYISGLTRDSGVTVTDAINDNIFIAGASARAWTDLETNSFLKNPWQILEPNRHAMYILDAAAGGRIMSSLANHGGLAGHGGIAGQGGGLAG